MALAAVADDCDLFSLDQIEIGVGIVIHAHGRAPGRLGRDEKGAGKRRWAGFSVKGRRASRSVE
jgi:hypothetical protein